MSYDNCVRECARLRALLEQLTRDNAALRDSVAILRQDSARVEQLISERDRLRAEVERLRAALVETTKAIDVYVDNCAKDHKDDCRWCRDEPDGSACPCEPRDDFLDLRYASAAARKALAGAIDGSRKAAPQLAEAAAGKVPT